MVGLPAHDVLHTTVGARRGGSGVDLATQKEDEEEAPAGADVLS